MRSLIKTTALLILVAGILASCEKRTAKFHPGDRVRVKLTDTKGLVAVRLSPFVDDQYYLQVSGTQRDLYKGGIPIFTGCRTSLRNDSGIMRVRITTTS
jgi:hypothetical protein